LASIDRIWSFVLLWRQEGVGSEEGQLENVGVDRKMPARRRAEIRALLAREGAAYISEIAAALGVSASTVRRDLDRLGEEGAVRRSHGGAVMVERTASEPLFADRRLHNRDGKARIGAYAAGLLEPGQSVFFDSSTTVLCAAEALGRQPLERQHLDLTGVTNDVAVACVLAETRGVRVVVPGGEVREGSFTLLGSHTQGFLGKLHVDVALVGMHAVSGSVLSESGLSVVEAKRAIMGAARRVVLLVDHGKFHETAFFEVARMEEVVDDLVTDREVPRETMEVVGAAGRPRVHVV
jgi:DeoR family transcriptional regulator of aga operon